MGFTAGGALDFEGVKIGFVLGIEGEKVGDAEFVDVSLGSDEDGREEEESGVEFYIFFR